MAGITMTNTLLPVGYLHTQGSQIVDAAGNPVRIVSVGWDGTQNRGFAPNGLNVQSYKTVLQQMVAAGFNTVRIPWSDALLNGGVPGKGLINTQLNPDLKGLSAIAVLQKIVAYAGQIGLKVIFDHHNNEGGGGQQPNGLWYDVGGAANGTDGAGNKGTVTQQGFIQDTQKFAALWANNPTVIGFDLDNEPVHSTWGGPATTSIQQMATQAGNAIQAVDPHALIIVEAPPSATGPSGDLTQVKTNPVTLGIPNQVVYSVHEYPQSVANNFSGNVAQYIQQLNNDWGYLVAQNIAPVWIGEMGSSMLTASDQLWAQTLLDYMNGKDGALGGPSFTGSQQGVSGDWWLWSGNETGYDPGGLLQSDWTTLKPEQMVAVQQMFPFAAASAASQVAARAAVPGLDTLVLSVSEDAYNGDARFTVAIDGKQVGGVLTATVLRSQHAVQSFAFTGQWGAGPHTVTVTYLNDVSGGAGKDRNLFVNGLSYDGAVQPMQRLDLVSNGARSITVPAVATAVASAASGTVQDTLVLQLAEDAYKGDVQFTVSVDGKQMGAARTVTAANAAGQVQTVDLSGTFGAGPHLVGITVLNGLNGAAGHDRSLFVKSVVFDGATQAVSPVTLGAGGSLGFLVTGVSTAQNGAITLGNDTAGATLSGAGNQVWLQSGTHAIDDESSGLLLMVSGGSANVTHFGAARGAVVDLLSGVGGYQTAAQALAAVHSDGAGGSILSLGAGALDFAGLAPSALSLANFRIG
jgi:aryl-phospho-beta-D-glucosidase BglC (GH1 family)